MKFGCRETGDHEKEDLGMAILINEEEKVFYTLNNQKYYISDEGDRLVGIWLICIMARKWTGICHMS